MKHLLRPNILPDEMGTGYLSFIAQINAMSEKEIIRYAKTRSPRASRTTTFMAIANLAEISYQGFIRSHSLKPFLDGFEESPDRHFPHGTKEERQKREKVFPRNRKDALFCEQCAQEDLETWGRSYWRRTHQVPGICWCLKHKIPLLCATLNDSMEQPHTLTEQVLPCLKAPFPSHDSIEERYIRVATKMLEIHSPIYTGNLCGFISSACRSKSLTCHPYEQEKKLLSDVVLECCSNSWCNQLFENFSKKKPKEHFTEIDGCWIHVDNQATTYALAMAILFEDPDYLSWVIYSSFRIPQKSKKIDPGL